MSYTANSVHFNFLVRSICLSLVGLILLLTMPPLLSAAEVLASSVHKGFGCQVCHATSQGGGPADCTRCHENQVAAYKTSIHSVVDKTGRPAATCFDCHGSHEIRPVSDPDSMVSAAKIPHTCGRCHPRAKDGYSTSVHFQIFKEDPVDAPECCTCHGYHKITPVKDQSFVRTTSRTCGTCHAKALDTYRESLHGQVTALNGRGATCWDCHSSHEIMPVDSVSSGTRVSRACRRCHGRTDALFMSYWPHADVRDKNSYPVLYYGYIMMKMLFIFVMITASIHSLSWLRAFPRLIRARMEKPHGRPYVYYLRFPAWHRLTHFILFVSVLGLSLSGLPLRYSETLWARDLVGILGGLGKVRLLHRWMAGLLFTAVLLHIYYLVRLIMQKGLKEFWNFLLSPDSLFPKFQDFREAWAEFQCFLRGTPEPKRDKWSYWEKFDYWAVFWGMIVIGGSGLALAFPEFVTRFLPGWILNVALVFHSEEALLAVFFLFIFHFFHSHLRPMKFPIDESIFTGSVSEEDFFFERQLEVERKSLEELEKMTVSPPSLLFRLAVYVIGFIAVDIGLILIACILYTAWKTGRLLP